MIKNNYSGFTTTNEAQYESNLSYLPSAVGAKACRAFTLIEALVAVTILTLATAGPLYSASRALVAAEISRDRLVASYLAQEGIEYVRVMRDDAYLAEYDAGSPNASEEAWDEFISGNGDFSIRRCGLSSSLNKKCTLDPSLPMCTGNSNCSLKPCGNGNACEPLYLNNNTYIQQQNGTETVFTRTIRAYTLSVNEEKIVSTVSWDSHGTTYSVVITSHLTPWQ